MCGGPEHIKPATHQEQTGRNNMVENNRKVSAKVTEMSEACSSLHELAANNDLIGFKKAMEEEGSKIDEVNLWYCRQNGSNLMVLDHRTPLMVAALYGSVDVLSYMLSIYAPCGADVNQFCGSDKTTALHCAAASGSSVSVEAVRMLLQAGADVNCLDALGRKPADMISISPRLRDVKSSLGKLLNSHSSSDQTAFPKVPGKFSGVQQIGIDAKGSEGSCATAVSSEVQKASCSEGNNEKKEYPVDTAYPDIKNIMYSTDEFRMYSFKVRPCSRAYSHDWTECPFVHPGENARRRDPRKFHYSCVPCPDFRKGACRRGDTCEYAHGVFECWLHPAQYRTRLCKDGTNCTRRVCFFAHTNEELRPLFVSTGSAVPSPSPRAASNSLDISSVMSPLAPGSPSSVAAMMSPFQQQGSVLTPPMSPSGGMGMTWPQPNVPTLHLPGNNMQSSRLRAELNARDMPLDDSPRDYETQQQQQLLNELSSAFSTQARINAAAALSGSNSRSAKYKSHAINGNVPPTNLEDMFASEVSSPRAMLDPHVFPSPLKVPHTYNQMIAPVNTQGIAHAHSGIEPQSPGHSLMQSPFHCSSYAMASPGRISSPRCVDMDCHNGTASCLSPARALSLNSRAAAALIQRDKRSHSSRELGGHVPAVAWSDWGSPSPTGKVDWGVHAEDLSKLRKSSSFGPRSYEEPDLSWVQSLVKDNTPEGNKDGSNNNGGGCSSETPKKTQMENVDHSVLGAWIEQMQLDQIVA